MKKLLIVITAFTFLLGVYFRFQGVFTNSFAFTYDVGRDMLALRDLVYNHKISLIGFTTGLPGVFYGPWWYWILAPVFFIFQGDPQGVSLYMALFGVATFSFGFFVGKKLVSLVFGLFLGMLLALSPALISLSAQIWNPNIIPVFLVSLIWLLGSSYTKKEIPIVSAFCIGILLSLIMDLEIVFGILLIISTVLASIVYLRKYWSIKTFGISVIGFLIILSPRLLFDIRHQFLMSKSLIKLTSPEPGSISFSLVAQFAQRAQMFFEQWSFSFTHNIFIDGLLLALVIITLLVLTKRKEKKYTLLIGYSLITIFVYLLGLTVFRHMIFSHYIVALPVFFLLLVALCLTTLWEMGKTPRILSLGILLILLWFMAKPLQNLSDLQKPLWVGDASVYRNQVQVIDYVYQKAEGRPFKINVYTPPVYDYTYQYLFSWYGNRKYHYIPALQTKLAFFILEPDRQSPGRLADWLLIRQHDGIIISEKTFPSGIRVQIRK